MSIEQIKGAIEAILFSMGDPVELGKLAEVLEIDKETVRNIMADMIDGYERQSSGITIMILDNKYQMCTKKQYYDFVSKATNKMIKYSLTDIIIETLSIVAYKQPITRNEIESIRGVKSDHAINKLIEYNLIEEKGRLDTLGRPILFGTTDAFLRGFGLSSTNDLPEIDEEMIHSIKQEIEKEVQISFDDIEMLQRQVTPTQADLNEQSTQITPTQADLNEQSTQVTPTQADWNEQPTQVPAESDLIGEELVGREETDQPLGMEPESQER